MPFTGEARSRGALGGLYKAMGRLDSVPTAGESLRVGVDARIMRRAADRTDFQLLLSALRLHPPVSVTTLQEVRRQISQAAHARQRDLDDAIYLACALDGSAQVLTSNDATLLGLGSPYAGVRIVPWQAFVEELWARGLITPDT